MRRVEEVPTGSFGPDRLAYMQRILQLPAGASQPLSPDPARNGGSRLVEDVVQWRVEMK